MQRPVFAKRRKPRIGRWLLIGLALLVAGCGVYTAIDNGRNTVRTQRVLVPSLPESMEGFTVLLISDLNGMRFGPEQRELRRALQGRKYNAVCLAGDMVGEKGDVYPLLELLAALDTTKPVYFIAGDEDPAPLGGDGGFSVLADWVVEAQTRGAKYLDAPVSQSYGKGTVWFSDARQLPLDLDTAAAAYAASGSAASAYQSGAIARTAAARAQMNEEDLHIVLSHPPVTAESIQRMRGTGTTEEVLRGVDIFLSGGTAGGQWRLPLVGPVWSDGWFPREETVLGYRKTGGYLQYISGGLNVSGKSPLPPFRLFNTPEVTLITFTSEMDVDALP